MTQTKCRGVITVDDSRVCGAYTVFRRQSLQKSLQSPRLKKPRQVRSSTESMLIFLFDIRRVPRCDSVPRAQTVNAECCCDVLKFEGEVEAEGVALLTLWRRSSANHRWCLLCLQNGTSRERSKGGRGTGSRVLLHKGTTLKRKAARFESSTVFASHTGTASELFDCTGKKKTNLSDKNGHKTG